MQVCGCHMPNMGWINCWEGRRERSRENSSVSLIKSFMGDSSTFRRAKFHYSNYLFIYSFHSFHFSCKWKCEFNKTMLGLREAFLHPLMSYPVAFRLSNYYSFKCYYKLLKYGLSLSEMSASPSLYTILHTANKSGQLCISSLFG